MGNSPTSCFFHLLISHTIAWVKLEARKWRCPSLQFLGISLCGPRVGQRMGGGYKELTSLVRIRQAKLSPASVGLDSAFIYNLGTVPLRVFCSNFLKKMFC
jgi:hypothetical protein